MKQITDLDEGTIRRLDWQALIPPVIFFRAFTATFKPTFLILGSVVFAFLAKLLGVVQIPCVLTCPNGKFCFNSSSQFIFRNAEFGGVGATVAIVFSALFALWFFLAFSRSNVVALTSSSKSSIIASAVFASKKFASTILPGILPFVVGATICLGAFIVEKCGKFGELCAPLTILCLGVCAFLFLIFCMTLPLAISAIAAENTDCFDAVSRGFSYVTQRFFFYILYMIFGTILTVLGLGIVDIVTNACVNVFDSIYNISAPMSCGWLAFWRLSLTLVPLVYAFMAFVVYSNAIYIMLRRSLDGTPYDSCVLELSGGKPRKLREILFDSKGAPGVAESWTDITEKEQEKGAQPCKNEQKETR